MLAVSFALLALLPMQEATPPTAPTAPTATAPASDPVSDPASAPAPAPAPESEPVAPPAPAESAPVVEEKPDACLALLKEGKREEAQRCYADRALAENNEDDARLARELADLVASLKLREPTLTVAPEPPLGFDFAGLIFTGKAELIATSTLVGAYVATTAATGALGALCNFGSCGGPISALVLVAPVAGGGLGLGISTATMLAMSGLSVGDVNAVRALMLLGTFDSILVPVATLGSFGSSSQTMIMTTFGMVAVQSLGIGAGIAVASLTELPEGAGSLALSTGLWTSVIGVLGGNMFGLFRQPTPTGVAFFLFGTANLGFAGGMIASPYFPISRAETWAIDVGGAVGLLAGASLAFQTKAPNPFIGWGTMAVGTGIGMGAGFAAARYLPPVIGGLPEIVAFAPIVDDDVTGALVVGRF